jgi:hypothetical protein
MMMMMTSEPCDHGDANNKVEDATVSSVFVSTEDSSSTSNLPLTGLLQIFSIDSEDSNRGGRSNKNSNPTAIYNIPGGLEKDPELIRGEMMFYNTPSTEKYSEHAYDSLINIQNQCSVDYDYFCGAQQFEPVSINDIMSNMFSSPLLNNNFFFNRRLSASNADLIKPLKSGADYVHFIRSELSKRTNLLPASPLSSLFFRSDLTHSLKKVMDPSSSPLKDFKAARITDRVGSNSVARIHSTVVSEKEVSPTVMNEDTGVRSTVQRRAAPGWVKPEDVEVSTAVEKRVLSGTDDAEMESDASQLKDESNYGDSFNVFDLLYQDGDLSVKHTLNAQSSLYPWDQRNVMGGAVSISDSSSGEDSSSSIHGDKHSFWGFGADKEHDLQDKRPRQEDTSFAGNLGFGADGDMCLYRNMDRLSSSCSSAVADLYMLRESYWREYQDQQHGPPPPFGCGLLAIGLLAVVFLARRYFGYKRQQQVRSLLTALHTHPDLKARVESETGVSVPMPYTGHCCRTSNASTGTCPFRVCKLVLCRLLRVLLFFAFLLLSSLFITVSSLELTFMMLQLIDAGASQDPVTGDLQLTSPFVALLILFSICAAQLSVLAVIIRAIKRCMVSRCQDSKRPPSPSAPVSEDSNSATPPSSIPSAVTTSKSVQYYFTSLPAALWDHHSSSSRPSEVYTPLLSQEDKDDDIVTGGAQMIAMSQTTSTAKPQLPQYAMVVPLTARPVNSISMV